MTKGFPLVDSIENVVSDVTFVDLLRNLELKKRLYL